METQRSAIPESLQVHPRGTKRPELTSENETKETDPEAVQFTDIHFGLASSLQLI